MLICKFVFVCMYYMQSKTYALRNYYILLFYGMTMVSYLTTSDSVESLR